MDQGEASGVRGELRELLEKKLIQEYCRDPKTNAALGETIWTHCQETVRSALRGLVFGSRRMCPEYYEATAFIESGLSRAWEIFVRKICDFRELDSARALKAWLGQVADSAAWEELRTLIGRGEHKKEYRQLPESGKGDKDGEEDWFIRLDEWLSRLQERAGVSRGVMAAPVPRPDELVARRERKLILRALIIRYGQQSQEDNESAGFVRLWCWAGWNMTRIAEHRHGSFETERQENTKLKHVSRKLVHDFGNLRHLLATEYGITSISQI